MPIYVDKRTGNFFVQFDYNKQTFKQHLPPGSTRKDAQRLEAKMRSDAFSQANGLAPREDILFEDFVQENYLPYVKNNLCAQNYERAENICIAAKPFLRGRTLRSIKADDIERFKTYRTNLLT